MGERLFRPQDAHKLEDPARLIWLPVADVIPASAIRAGMHVADVGAGTGYFAIPLAQAVGLEKNRWTAARPINIGRYSYFITAHPPRIIPDVSAYHKGKAD